MSPKDHKPAHVHIIGPDAEAKFDIESLECLANHGFTPKAIRELQNYLGEGKSRLKEIWDELQE